MNRGLFLVFHAISRFSAIGLLACAPRKRELGGAVNVGPGF